MKVWVAGAAFVLLAGAIFLYSQDPFASVQKSESPELNTATTTSIVTMPPKPESDFVPLSEEHSDVVNDDVSATAKEPVKVCTGGESANFDCYERHYVRLVKELGIKAAFADLKARYPQNAYLIAQCHPVTHVIGREAALKFKTPGEAYVQGDSFCWSGYYHGVLETFVGKIGRKNLPNEIDRICDGVDGKERLSFDYYNCVHGLGHGVMAITDDELFESLDYCDDLTGTWEQQSCASGVYMENVIVDNLNHFTKYLKPAEPLYPCTASPEKYKNTCYLMQTSYILKVNGGDFSDTFAWCRKAEDSYQGTCFQSLGRDASGRSSSRVPETKRICLLGENFFERSNCVIGAVKDFISYFHSDTQAEVFCASLSAGGGSASGGEDQQLVDTCRLTATSYYAQF